MKDLIFALIWFAVLGIYIFVSWKDAKSNNDVKKEITQMNELLLEQNTQLRKQNDHLNMVILSVCSRYRPAIDVKRPFGNSGPTTNVCEIMGWHCDEESGEYAAEDIEKAEMLIIELPVALQIVMQNHTFEPGEYEVGEYSSAYFNYVHIRNYHALKSPIAEIEEKYKDCDQMERLHEVCMNVSGDNPWKVIDDLKWFAQTDFLADAIVVFEKHRDEQILDEWLKTHDGEDYCKYCPENAECPHGMACYCGEPIEPSCYGADMKEFLYTDSIIEDALEERYGEE